MPNTKLYGFMQDKTFYEDLGHILIGLVPMWGWIREMRQWPPGSDQDPPVVIWDDGTYTWVEDEPENVEKTRGIDGAQTFFAANRVEDSYRDFLGYEWGSTLRTVALVGVIVWLVLK